VVIEKEANPCADNPFAIQFAQCSKVYRTPEEITKMIPVIS
jgi:hypothetical protein